MRMIYVVFAALLMVLMATPGNSQSKKSCSGCCSRTCAKGQKGVHTEGCRRRYCCMSRRKKKQSRDFQC
uniref:Uncharacterized protein n=1 Tax=Dromaius novaehollandiae TaxID=8790 RepID=A0A8C4PDS2_DRONO